MPRFNGDERTRIQEQWRGSIQDRFSHWLMPVLGGIVTVTSLATIPVFAAEAEAATIDLGALTGLERIVGFLITLASAILLAWVVEHNQTVVDPSDFAEARSIAMVATAIFTALMFAFLADSDGFASLGYIAVACIMVCFLFFLWNARVRHTRGVPDRTPNATIGTAYLGTFIIYITCGSVGLSAAGLIVYVHQTNTANVSMGRRPGDNVTVYEVRAAVSGRRVVKQTGDPTSFRASSGQVNFGCEQTVKTTATWNVPAGAAVQGEVKAEWVNLANAKGHQATATVEGDKVVGTGTITGLDTQRISLGFGSIGNCPGGGHGELVVSGTYVPKVEVEEPIREELSGQLSALPQAQTLRLTLPSADVLLQEVTVVLTKGGEVVDSAVVRPSTPQGQKSEKGLFEVSIIDRQLVVTLQELH